VRRSIPVASVTLAEVQFATSVEESVITVNALGNADMRAKDAFDSVLSNVHEEALRLESKEVIVDLRNLEFMNSSCLKCLVTWIGKIQALEPARRYHVRLVSRSELLWQRRSLHALRSFATDLVSIENVESD
jgi:anti-anti-sigma factor